MSQETFNFKEFLKNYLKNEISLVKYLQIYVEDFNLIK
jgi:hypothetical protein